MGKPGKRSSGRSASAGPADSDGARSLRGLLPGGRLGDYELLDLLGQGAMGRVFRAHDPAGREVAIKVLSDKPEADDAERFQREGEALAAIPPHRHVVTVHSMGTVHGRPYLVLDLIEGQTLQERLIKGPRSQLEAAELVEKLCGALDHIHQAGVLHRDLKPANIILQGDEPVVTDFGMASLAGSARLTRSGGLYGTPAVMAPEQILGQASEVDGRSDVWALGVLLYQLLAGELPFPAQNLPDLAKLIVREDPTPLASHRPDLDPELGQLVERALAKSKDDRFDTPGHMARALRLWRISHMDSAELAQQVRPTPRRIPWRALAVAGGGLLTLLLLGAGWSWWSERTAQRTRGALLESQTALLMSARDQIPNLLGRGPRWPRPSKLDRLDEELASLEQQADQAEVPLDTGRIHELLDYMRYEQVLREGDEAAAVRYQERLPSEGEIARLVRARQALGQGQSPTEELQALADSSDPWVSAAGRVLLARVVALQDPHRARELLAQSADDELVAAEVHYVDALVAIRAERPNEGTHRDAVGAIHAIPDSSMLARLRLEALTRAGELAQLRPWQSEPVQSLLQTLAELPPLPESVEAPHTQHVTRLVAEFLGAFNQATGASTVDLEPGLLVLERAGVARLRGLERHSGIQLFDALTTAVLRGLPSLRYLRGVETLIELDVPLLGVMLGHMPEPRGRGATVEYMRLLWRLRQIDEDPDDLAGDTRTREEKKLADAREDAAEQLCGDELREKLLGEWSQELGPKTRAAGLMTSLYENMSHEASQAVVTAAYELDPENPTVLLHMAQLHGLHGDKRGCSDFAARALEGFRVASRARQLLGYSLLPKIMEDIVELQARYGDPGQARELANELLELDLRPEDREDLNRDLKRWLEDRAE